MSVRATFVFLVCASVAGCTPAPRSATPQPRGADETSPPQPGVFEMLHALERPASPLSALPADSRTVVESIAMEIPDAERQALLDGKSSVAAAHPLLHWALGGSSLDVYAAAVNTPALADEWVAIAQEGPRPNAEELVGVANELVRRAAQHLLRERAADFAEGREPPSAEVWQQVIAAAHVLGAQALWRRAVEAWATVDEGPKARWLLVNATAKSGDVARARAALQQLESGANFEGEALLGAARRDLKAAEVIARGGADALTLARAQSRLERFERARATLEQSDVRGLAHATELLRARLGGSACPFVLRPNRTLCSAAFAHWFEELDIEAVLDGAWASGAGRDIESVSHHLGLRYVARLMYQARADGSAMSPQEFTATLADLQRRAREATAVDSRFEALAIIANGLAEAVTATLSASGSDRPLIPAQRRSALRQQAARLLGRGNVTWASEATLATFALSVQDDALGSEIDALPDTLVAQHGVSLARLELWTALADRDLARFGALEQSMVALTRATDAQGLERTKWLLTWAEAEMLLRPSETTRATLLGLCSRLQAEATPLELRLRAHLDSAGILARAGQRAEAAMQLGKVVESVPRGRVASPEAQDLLVALTGYHQVLLSLSGTAGPEAARRLEGLLLELSEKSAASPSVLMWLSLWRGELLAREVSAGCGNTKACRERADRARGISGEALERAVGARTAALLRAGVLALGGAEIDVRYSDEGELKPRVGIELAFPVVQVPEF